MWHKGINEFHHRPSPKIQLSIMHRQNNIILCMHNSYFFLSIVLYPLCRCTYLSVLTLSLLLLNIFLLSSKYQIVNVLLLFPSLLLLLFQSITSNSHLDFFSRASVRCRLFFVFVLFIPIKNCRSCKNDMHTTKWIKRGVRSHTVAVQNK